MSKAIGSIVKIEKDIQVTKILSGENKAIEAGTTTVVNADGDLFVLTGTEQNTIVNRGYEVYGYDTKSIAQLIFRRLNLELNLGDILNENDIEVNDFIELTESMLDDIL